MMRKVLFLLLSASLGFCAITRAQDNSRFAQVAAKLDEGGSAYFYLNAESILRALLDRAAGFASQVQQDRTRQTLDQAFTLLGLYDLRDVAWSGAYEEADLYRSKAYLGLAGPRQRLFATLGGEPHPFESLAYAPPSTDCFASIDLDVERAEEVVRGLVGLVGPQGEAYYASRIKKVDRSIQKSGIEGAIFHSLLKSLAGEFVLIADFEPEGEPRILLMARARDPRLYDFLRSTLQRKKYAGEETQENGVRKLQAMLTTHFEYARSAVLAFDGEYVMLASHADFLDRALLARQSKDALAGTDAFRKLTRGLPEKGNGLVYSTQEGLEGIRTIAKQWQGFAAPVAALRALNPLFRHLAREGAIGSGMASVRVNEADGIRIARLGPRGRGFLAALPIGLAGVCRALVEADALTSRGP